MYKRRVWVFAEQLLPVLSVSCENKCIEELNLVRGEEQSSGKDQDCNDHIEEGISCNAFQHRLVRTIPFIEVFDVPVDSFVVAFFHLYISPCKGNEENQPYKLCKEKNVEC